jgi:hypothetical protein
MRDDNLHATTSYHDYTGTIAADRKDQLHLDQLAEKFGADLSKYYIIGINIYFGEMGNIDERIIVNFLAIDMKVLGAGDNDSIQRYINKHDGILPYVKLTFTRIGIVEILDYFKRVDLVLTYRNIVAQNYQLTD